MRPQFMLTIETENVMPAMTRLEKNQRPRRHIVDPSPVKDTIHVGRFFLKEAAKVYFHSTSYVKTSQDTYK